MSEIAARPHDNNEALQTRPPIEGDVDQEAGLDSGPSAEAEVCMNGVRTRHIRWTRLANAVEADYIKGCRD